MMFNNGLPDLSLFCCISLLCLPHCLSAHLTCAVCSSAFYALCAMSIRCTVPLLCSSAAALSSFFTHEFPSPTTITTTSNSNNNPISSLYRVFIASVHLVHAMFAMPLHADSASVILHLSSALSDHHHDSSASLVVHPASPASLYVILRFLSLSGSLRLFVFSVTVELTFSVSVTGLNAHQLSITSTNIFIPLRDSSPPLPVIP
jgi:hypothetical protein